MNAYRLTLAALACSLPLMAAAQYQWVDKDGRRVFSDQAPPADVPVNKIVKPSGIRSVAPTPPAEAVPPATATGPASAKVDANAPKLSGKDKELEAKKKQAEAAEAARKKLEEEKVVAAKADNCDRAKKSKAGFDSGVRITRTNAAGEREFLDDKQRADEVKRLEMLIARDCQK